MVRTDEAALYVHKAGSGTDGVRGGTIPARSGGEGGEKSRTTEGREKSGGIIIALA